MLKLTFKGGGPLGGATCVLPDGSVIERYEGRYRNGGSQYEFKCTCGWHGKNGSYKSKSNKAANIHATNCHCRQKSS